MTVTTSVAGGSLFVHLPQLPRSATQALMTEALAHGVRIRSAEHFHRAPPDHVTLVLSYAGVSEANLKRAGARLAEAYFAVKEKGLCFVGEDTSCKADDQQQAVPCPSEEIQPPVQA